MKVNLKMIKQKGKEFINIKMVMCNLLYQFSYMGEYLNNKKEG